MEFNIWIMCENNLVAPTKMTIFGNFGGIDRSILVHYLQESNFFANWPLLHFFVISISRFTFGDFSHISADFSNIFINFSPTFVHLSWTFHRFYCLFCQQRIQVETFFVTNAGWLLFKNKCFSFINHKLALTKLGGSTFFAPWTIIAGYKCRKGKYWEF